MNAALQGYLAAMEESLSATDALADAGSELVSVAALVDGNTELTLAINDGSVPVPSRRALLDHLLEGKVRPEVQRLVHQAVSVVPASELDRVVPLAGVAPDPGRGPGADRRSRRAEPGPGRRRRNPRMCSAGWARATGCPATPPPCSRR